MISWSLFLISCFDGWKLPDAVKYRHGLTRPMRDARKRRFRREPDLNLVQRVEEDLLNITAGGTAETIDVEPTEQEKERDANARNAHKNPAPAPVPKPDIPGAGINVGEPDRSESDESDQTSSWGQDM